MLIIFHLVGLLVFIGYSAALFNIGWNRGFEEAVDRWTEAGQARDISQGKVR